MALKQMSLAEAKAAWESDKENADKGLAYLTRLVAAHHLGQVTEVEAKAMAMEMRTEVERQVGPELSALVDKLVKAGAPVDVIVAAMHAHDEGHELGVISVGADGVAVVHHLSSEPDDGIGTPVGNA